MGSVYEATHESTGQKVAVKLIANHVADEMRFRRRFAAEVETLRRLRHENIVGLIGYGEEKGQLFYAMELVHGESLRTVIRRERRLSWVRAVDIATQVCAALKHAHDIGVIHRDLKPANLLLTGGGRVMLVDFGIAKLFGFGEQTMEGSVLGTADYMAPEQADGLPITTRTDLYSLGSSMYAMLSGRPPFSDKSSTKVIEALRHERPVSLRLIDENLPEDLVNLVDHLLEKKPEDRPPTARAVGNRLKAMKAGLLREATRNDKDSVTKVGQQNRQASPSSHRSARDADTDSGRGGTDPVGPKGQPGGQRIESDLDSNDWSLDRSDPVRPDSDRIGEHDPRNHRGGRRETGGGEMSPAGPADLTVASQSGRATVQPPSVPSEKSDGSNDVNGQTSFHAVDPSQRADLFSGSEPSSEGRYRWIQTLSIMGMVLILAGGIVLFWMSVRTPSADQLFTRIRAADRADNLLAAEPLMRQFITEYPDDGRLPIVEDLREELELDRYLKRLAAKAKRVDGVEHLSPHEQAFYRAMQLRQASPGKAKEQLQAWLTLFANSGGPIDLQIESMAAMARGELQRLVGRPTVHQTDSRVEDLTRRFREINELPTAEERIRGLNALVDSFRSEQWAETVVKKAQEEIAVIRDSLPDPTPSDDVN